MNPCATLYFLVSIILSGGAAFETSPTALGTADRLYDTGFWDAAITEYQRHIYIHPNSLSLEYCSRRISRCHQNMGDLNEALSSMRTAVAVASNDSVRFQRRLDVADIWVEMGNRAMGELEYSRLANFSTYPTIQRSSSLKLATVLLDSYRWRDASEQLSRLENLTDESHQAKINSAFGCLDEMSFKSPSTARRLSTFLPGSGQVYSGNWQKGIHSFALVGAWVALIAYSIREDRIALAVFSIPWFARYYQGGRYHAAKLAIEHNRAQIRKPIEDIISEIHAIERKDSSVISGARTP
jgi:hypothetical protein